MVQQRHQDEHDPATIAGTDPPADRAPEHASVEDASVDARGTAGRNRDDDDREMAEEVTAPVE
jgi:hypothetical protein